MEHQDNITTTIRLEKETVAFLDELARNDERDRSYLIRQAVSNYVEMRKWELEQIKQAIKEADSGLFATDEEVKKKFDKWTA